MFNFKSESFELQEEKSKFNVFMTSQHGRAVIDIIIFLSQAMCCSCY